MTPVSIALAVYNGQRHIQRQLESLAAQTHQPAELIISDDASTDDTLKIVDAFAKTAPFPVHVHCNDIRLGYRANFIKAASLCRSELIAFCDHDDYWYPHKIAQSLKAFQNPNILLTFHNADVVTEDGNRIGSLINHAAQQPILEPLSSGPWLSALGFSEIIRRSLLSLSYLWAMTLDPNTQGQPMAHDQWFFFLASVFGKIAYLDEPLVEYCQHGSNNCGWKKVSFAGRTRELFRDRPDEYWHLAKVAERRAVVLELAQKDLVGIWAERAAAGCAYYRVVSSIFDKRRTLYAAPNFGDRLNVFCSIMKMDGYTGAQGVGRRGLAVDLLLGVIPTGSLVRSIAG